MQTRSYEGKKFEGGNECKTVDYLTVEEALQININNKPFSVTMRTPGDDIFLIRGLLHSEDIIKDVNFNLIIDSNKKSGILSTVELYIPEEELGYGYLNSRNLLSVSSCGICGRTQLDELSKEYDSIKDESKLDIKLISYFFDKMKDYQHNFRQSGGAHAAAAFSLDGKLIASREDIGRHNAVDKVVGDLIISKKLKKASVMLVSGRISYEIIIKCFKSNISFLAAVSAPSSLAVDYAKELGITLFGFSRNGRTTCYSRDQRVK